MIIFKGFKLDDTIEFDKEVFISWNCADIQNALCCNFLGNIPSVKNLRSNKIELYTLADMWASNLVIDVSKVTIASTGLNIIDDFLNSVSERFINTDKYNGFLARYDEIRSFLYFRFRNNWEINLANFVKISNSYDRSREANMICSNILERMIISVPERFSTISLDEIVELPFVVGDYLYVIYTINYLDITTRYKINIILV
jgi:hypothetical protein